MEGLKRGTVMLLPHDTAWAESAERVIAVLRETLGEALIDAQHVGSTAIAGIAAKPIIDLAAAVKSSEAMEAHNAELAERGTFYRKREHGDQLLYACGDITADVLTHHIHVVKADSEAWENYLNFRDYLNCHPAEAAGYSALKETLAERYSHDRSTYTAGKVDFVEKVLRNARAWRETVCGSIL